MSLFLQPNIYSKLRYFTGVLQSLLLDLKWQNNSNQTADSVTL